LAHSGVRREVLRAVVERTSDEIVVGHDVRTDARERLADLVTRNLARRAPPEPRCTQSPVKAPETIFNTLAERSVAPAELIEELAERHLHAVSLEFNEMCLRLRAVATSHAAGLLLRRSERLRRPGIARVRVTPR
jgi:hypothetical protein